MKRKRKPEAAGQPELVIDGESLRIFAREEIERRIRANTLRYALDIMQEEVETLCGQRHQRKKGRLAYRGGTEPGSVVINGTHEKMLRPRVRTDEGEVRLQSYDALHSYERLPEFIFLMMMNGISSRGCERSLAEHEAALGVTKSAASREFIENSRADLNEINQRRFPGRVFWALVVDGLHLAGEAMIVALGIDLSGEKHFLGISQGSTENTEVVLGLLSNLRDREIQFTKRIVAVLDGAKALRRALRDHFGSKNVAFQRCLNHKKWNVARRLTKEQVSEVNLRITQAFNCNDYATAKKEMEKVLQWLETFNHNAAESLREGFEDLLTLHRIGVPPALRKSLYTTNLIDSAFSKPRAGLNRVKRWRKDSDMMKRWTASHLLEQERRFRRINAPHLIKGFLEDFLTLSENLIDIQEAA